MNLDGVVIRRLSLFGNVTPLAQLKERRRALNSININMRDVSGLCCCNRIYFVVRLLRTI